MAKILVVDDESGIRDVLCDGLHLAGFDTVTAIDGFDALKILRDEPVDLIIADINMPRIDGYEMLERLREQGNQTPALLLTARHDRADITRGLRLGADDYVTKPFGLEELTLRVKAILRRTNPDSQQVDSLKLGPLELIDSSHSVLLNGSAIELSPTEFKLLRYLMKQPKKVVRKEVLLDAIWGMGFATGATVVDTYISYLRKKLHTPDWQGIKTVRGIGFLITDEPAGRDS
jgi:two-component system OmpR family response regulator